MTARNPLLLLLGIAATLSLAACAAGPAPGPTDSPPAMSGAGTGGTESTDTSPASGEGPVRADGMPELPLEGCGELVDSEVSETGVDTQWSFTFECAARDAFDATVAALDALGTLAHPQAAVLGNDTYLSDRHHFIGDWDGQVLDVDLALTGAPDELEYVYLVTLRKPE